MKRPSRLSYAYAVGRVRALEKDLVDKAVFQEALEERDFANALKLIFDAGNFSEELIQIKDSTELDTFLEKEEEDIDRLLSEILLDEELMRIYRTDESPDKALAVAERSGYPFVQDYVRHRIDLGNIKIFFRAKYLGLPEDRLEVLVLRGGFVSEEFFLRNFALSLAEVGEELQTSPYKNLWTRAADALGERETFVELERGIEDFLMAYLKKAKYIVFGPEPVLAYGLAKKRELSLVRLIGVGKFNRIPDELLKERIGETYV
jgi:vacuolar-type H+-ATPase subunit C/Vma6